MPEGLIIYGFGQDEHPFIERLPMPRAEFQLPPDIEMRTTRVGDGYVELTMRVPIPRFKAHENGIADD